MKALVIVLNYNGREHLKYAVPSIDRTDYDAASFLIIDNASTDGGLVHMPRTKNTWQRMQLLRNVGWAAGNNVGIRLGLEEGYEIVALLNNDVELHPLWLRRAVEALEGDRTLGAVGFHVHEGTESAGTHRNYLTAYANLQAAGPPVLVTHVGGMAMVVRSLVFKTIGPFDEAFFAYGEEIDFQIRMRRHLFRIARINVPVWHYGGGSFSKISRRASYLQVRNNMLLAVKHMGWRDCGRSAIRYLARFGQKKQTKDVQYGVEKRLSHGPWIQRLCIGIEAALWLGWMFPRIVALRLGRRECLKPKVWS